MKHWYNYLILATLITFTACHACVFGGWDVSQYCEVTDHSLLRVDEAEYSFQVYSDSIRYVESEDSLRIYYGSLLGTTISLCLYRPTLETFSVDTMRSWVTVYNDQVRAYDTLSLTNPSVIVEAYQPGSCCDQQFCSQPTPDEFRAQVLGILGSGQENRVLYFDIDITTRPEEFREC